MEAVLDFLLAALPWLTIGLVLAVFFARSARNARNGKKETDEKPKDDYGILGMCLGMSIGSALGISMGNHTGIGISLGMLIGLVIGSSIKKEEPDDGEKA